MFLSGCLDSQDNQTEYKTNYTLHLDAIDSTITLDSARIDVYIDGTMDTSFVLRASDLDQRSVPLLVVTSQSSDVIEVHYEIYANGQLLANGQDSYDPSQSTNTPSPLALDTAAIRNLIASTSSSSSPPSSSSSSSTTGTYFIAFTAESGIAIEDAAPQSSNYPAVYVEVIGPAGTTLPEEHNVSISYGGSAGVNDFTSLPSSFTIPAHTPVGQTIAIPLSPSQDALVEGPEILTVNLSDPKSVGPALLYYNLTLQDADSAYVGLEIAQATIAEDSTVAQPVQVTLHTKPLNAKLAVPVQVKLQANSQSTAIVGTHYANPGSALTMLFTSTQGEGDFKSASIAPMDVAGWNADALLQLDLSILSGPAQTSGSSMNITIQNTDYEYIAILSPNNTYSKVTLYSPALDSLNTFAINDGTNNVSASALVLSTGHDIVYAIMASYGLWSYNTSAKYWSTPYTFQGSYSIKEGGMCSDGNFSTIEYAGGSLNYGMHNSYNLSGGLLDQETVVSGSNPLIYYRPCLPSSASNHGGLVLTPTSLIRYDWNGSELTGYTLRSFSNASGLAMLTTPNVNMSDVAYVIEGTTLHTISVRGDLYDKADIDLASTLGSGVAGTKHMLETPRQTLLLFAPDTIYEIDPANGSRIRAVRHSLGTITDAEYMDKGKSVPSP